MSLLKTWEHEMSNSLLMRDRVQEARRIIDETEERLMQVGERTFSVYEASFGRSPGAIQKLSLRDYNSDLHADHELSPAEREEMILALKSVQTFADIKEPLTSSAHGCGEKCKKQRVNETSESITALDDKEPSAAFSLILSRSASLGAQVKK